MLHKWKTYAVSSAKVKCFLLTLHRYCDAAELGDWKQVILKADRAMAMDFLDYLCERWKIISEGTSWEYWRQYKQLYSSVTGRYVDRNDAREVHKVCLASPKPDPQK